MRLAALLLFLLVPGASLADTITIAAVGDIMLGGGGTAVLAVRGADYPFLSTSTLLKNADLTIGNLEAPLTRGGTEFRDKRFRFRATPHLAPALKRAGLSVVTLANNHILDFGAKGLADTLFHLSSADIAYAGAGMNLAEARRPAIATAKGKTVGVLAYSLTLPSEFFAAPGRAGTAPGYLRHVCDDIGKLRGAVDHVVVSFHWGGELLATPRAYQVAMARAAVEAGADVIIGHHPHVLQGIERDKGGLILYSLGNFAFATPSTRSDRSVIALITLGRGVEELELVPLNVLNREVRLQPAVLDGKRGKRVIDYLNRLSAGMGTNIVSEGSRYVMRMGAGTVAAR